MNTAAATGRFGDRQQDVGFAIPINRALRIAKQIAQRQSPARRHADRLDRLPSGVARARRAAQPGHQAPQQQRKRQLLEQDQGSAGCSPRSRHPGLPGRTRRGAGAPPMWRRFRLVR